MTVEIEPVEIEETDTDLARCKVITTDATGERREYRIGVDPIAGIDGKPIQSGARVDENAPDEAAGGGVPSNVFEHSREYFEEQGFELV